uniref:ATP-binding protein n=2 Tax=Escherichia coli TaxID=562 RepID=UPI0013AF537B
SQLPVENWYKMIGDSTHADAILDRLVHGSIKIELKGESMRKIRKRKLTAVCSHQTRIGNLDAHLI